MPGAENQQERPFIEAIPASLGSYLAGFALGEASFMVVCRKRGDYRRSWKLSAAFNVSQHDRAPLDLFRATLRCGTMRRAGNGGWYWEVNRLPDLSATIVPFFERFPLVGTKGEDFARWADAVRILERGALCESEYHQVLVLRKGMNRGGKRRYRMDGILRGHTPSSPAEQPAR